MNPLIIRGSRAAEYYFEERCFITERSNGAEDEAVSIAQARVAPGVRTQRHCLQGITERYLILAGTGRVELGDMPPENVLPGDVVLIPPGMAQRIQADGDGELLFLAICTPRFVPIAYQPLDDG